jgi:hypothetical protein
LAELGITFDIPKECNFHVLKTGGGVICIPHPISYFNIKD